jgi:DNA-binding response OmpR family regulator
VELKTVRKILIVEDEAILREGYQMVLSIEPYEVMMAEDGERALQMCKETKFDLVLLDLMMPRVSGVMFLEKIRQQKIPLPKTIVMSNLSTGDDLPKAIALGAQKCLVKADLSPRQLLSMIRYELESN